MQSRKKTHTGLNHCFSEFGNYGSWAFPNVKIHIVMCILKKEVLLVCLRTVLAFGHRSVTKDKQDVLVEYFRSEHRSTSPTVYIILLSDRVPSRSFLSVCVHRKFGFFSVNIGEIFIIVAGLWYSFPIYLPEMRSQLKENHKRRAYM